MLLRKIRDNIFFLKTYRTDGENIGRLFLKERIREFESAK